MRGLITLVFLLAFGWSGWWFIGTSAQKSAIEAWMDQQRDAGWVVEVEEFKVTGYPNRFDSIFTNLTLGNPYAGWTWQGPDFQLLSLSYKPNHIIVVWPGTHSYTTGNGTVSIDSSLFRGSLVFKPETSLALDRMQLEVTDLILTGSDAWRATTSEASIAFFDHKAPDLPPNSYDLYVKVLEFSPPVYWRNAVNQNGTLPDTIPEVIFDASLTYDSPWDRFAFEQTNPRLTGLVIRDLRFVWGELHLSGEGTIEISNDGYAQGTFTLQVKNWRALLDILIAANLLPQDFATALSRGVIFIATLAGNPEDIEIPLRFADGLTYIGSVPIGRAPRIY